MKANLLGSKNNLTAVGLGVATTLILSLGLAAIAAALVGKGVLPVHAMPVTGWVVTALAMLAGALLCGGRADCARLPLCVAAGVIYLLLIFLLRGLILRSVGENLWAIPLCVLTPSVVGAMLTSRKKRRR